MSKYWFFAALATALVSTILLAGCNKTAAPDAPSVPYPYGSATGGVLSTYEFSSSAVDPGGDNVAIRFDWDDSDTSDWSALMPSGDTATASHAWADTGTFHVRAQAKNVANAVSEWSAALEVRITPGWTRTYGGPDVDHGRAVAQTADGGYFIAGYTTSFGEGQTDVYLLRVNSAGDTLWTRSAGYVGADYAEDVQPTSDGGCIAVGEWGTGDRQIWLIKMDASGSRQWDFFYGFGNCEELGSSVRPTSDGGYIVAGKTQDHGHDDAWLVKTDAAGATQWYADKGYDDYADYATCIRQTSDGGYIFTGTTCRYDSDGDIWLVKVGADGGTAWSTYFPTDDEDCGRAVQQTTDGGYIIGATIGPLGYEQLCLVKTDGNGGFQWTKTYGGASAEYCSFAQQTTEGGYIVGGSTQSSGAGRSDFYLVKTDASGNVLWEKTYGGPGFDWCHSAQQIADGGYILAGATDSYGAGFSDFYLVKTDAEGNCTP
jgi:hypothetical protein